MRRENSSKVSVNSEYNSFASTPVCRSSKLCDAGLLADICTYRGTDKSLARPGMKQANVSVRMA